MLTVGDMANRGISSEVPIGKSLGKTGKGPVPVRWVDVNKGGEGAVKVKCRLVARDCEGKDIGRDDIFAAKWMLLSRAATSTIGSPRKLLFIDAKKAHLNPHCEHDVYVELPEEAGCGPGICEN